MIHKFLFVMYLEISAKRQVSPGVAHWPVVFLWRGVRLCSFDCPDKLHVRPWCADDLLLYRVTISG